MKRVVTGVDGEGHSYVVSEEELPRTEPGTELWRFQPSDIAQWIADVPDGVAAESIEPPSGGVWWVAATFPPGNAPIGGGEIPGMDADGFHTTRTIDLIYVLSGGFTLLLDHGSARVEAGDIVIQQATRHAWRNVSDTEPATMLAMLHTPAAPAA